MKMPKLEYKALEITMPTNVKEKTQEDFWSERVVQVDKAIDGLLSQMPNVKSLVNPEQVLELENLAKTRTEAQRLLSRNFHLKKKANMTIAETIASFKSRKGNG